ncbi:hypothetical protein XMIN_3607 [Xanthomonas citri pv. mangiferaeindicae LMG 941]|nr:hypothetical protein XMIN_3607 [Xanthomonas citri pv. mangiferaeindicae LMG 941]
MFRRRRSGAAILSFSGRLTRQIVSTISLRDAVWLKKKEQTDLGQSRQATTEQNDFVAEWGNRHVSATTGV